MNAHVALQVAAEMDPDNDVLFIVPDDGQRYLSKHHSDEWMQQMRMLEPERTTLKTLLATKKGVPALVHARPEHTMQEALDLMDEHDLSQLPVLDGDENVGSLREADLLMHALESSAALIDPVGENMGAPFPELESDQHANHARQALREHPVVLVRERGRVTGLLTRHDVLAL
jgi:cystathionine beta-synthase